MSRLIEEINKRLEERSAQVWIDSTRSLDAIVLPNNEWAIIVPSYMTQDDVVDMAAQVSDYYCIMKDEGNTAYASGFLNIDYVNDHLEDLDQDLKIVYNKQTKTLALAKRGVIVAPIPFGLCTTMVISVCDALLHAYAEGHYQAYSASMKSRKKEG